MYNQIADDRDHIGFRFPTRIPQITGRDEKDLFTAAPGNPRDLFKYKNRQPVLLQQQENLRRHLHGSRGLQNIDPEFSKILITKAVSAFEYGLKIREPVRPHRVLHHISMRRITGLMIWNLLP